MVGISHQRGGVGIRSHGTMIRKECNMGKTAISNEEKKGVYTLTI